MWSLRWAQMQWLTEDEEILGIWKHVEGRLAGEEMGSEWNYFATCQNTLGYQKLEEMRKVPSGASEEAWSW